MLYDKDGYLIHGIYSSFLFKNRTLVHLGLAEYRATWLETTFFFFFGLLGLEMFQGQNFIIFRGLTSPMYVISGPRNLA